MDSGAPDDKTDRAPMPAPTPLRSLSSTAQVRTRTEEIGDENLVAGLLTGDRHLAQVFYDHLRPSIDISAAQHDIRDFAVCKCTTCKYSYNDPFGLTGGARPLSRSLL